MTNVLFSDELYSDIRLSGVSHLTAVSGMHLTLIMTVLSALLTATRLGYSYRVRFVITAALTVGFMAFFRLYGFGTEKRNNDYHGKHRRSVLPQERLS